MLLFVLNYNENKIRYVAQHASNTKMQITFQIYVNNKESFISQYSQHIKFLNFH